MVKAQLNLNTSFVRELISKYSSRSSSSTDYVTMSTPEEAGVSNGTRGHTSTNRIGRSQSLGGLPKRTKSTSMFEKIQQFEQGAQQAARNSTTNVRVERRASTKPSEETVVEDEIMAPSRSDSGYNSRQSMDVEIVRAQIKQEVVSPDSAKLNGTSHHVELQTQQPIRKPSHLSLNNSNSSQENCIPQNLVSMTESAAARKPPRSPAPVPVNSNPFTRQLSQQLEENKDLMNGTRSVAITRKARPGCNAEWTEHGIKAFSEAVIKQLELEFFNSDLILRGCIFSSEGNILCLTTGFRIKQYEIQTILTGMADSAFLTSSKLTVGGVQFSCLSGTSSVVRARVKDRGVNCTKIKPATSPESTSSNTRLSNSGSNINDGGLTIVVVYEHPVLPKQIAMLVRRVGNIIENSVAS